MINVISKSCTECYNQTYIEFDDGEILYIWEKKENHSPNYIKYMINLFG